MKIDMPKILAVLLACSALAGPVLAEEETLNDEQYCEEEARSSGLENSDEIAAYVRDCMGEDNTADHSLEEEAPATDTE